MAPQCGRCHFSRLLGSTPCYRRRAMRSLIVVLTLLSAACGRDATGPTFRSAPMGQSTPDLVLVNAKVFTADAAHPYAEALAIAGGRFTAIGTNAEIRRLAKPATRIIDV